MNCPRTQLFIALLCLGNFGLASAAAHRDVVMNQVFQRRLDAAVESLRTVLNSERSFAPPSDVDHGYEDKYKLADSTTNSLLGASQNVLQAIGLSPEVLADLNSQSINRNATIHLHLAHEERYEYLREELIELDAPTKVVKESGFLGSYTKERKVTQKVIEYVWIHTTVFTLSATIGASSSKTTLPFLNASYAVEVRRRAKDEFQELNTMSYPPLDITWLVRSLGATDGFSIDRSAPSCKTPRRNENVEKAVEQFRRIHAWNLETVHALRNNLQTASGIHKDLAIYANEMIVSPVLPLFDADTRGVLSNADTEAMLDEHKAAMEMALKNLGRELEASKPTNTLRKPPLKALSVIPLFMHWNLLVQTHRDGLNHIEDLLRLQLTRAVGKELTENDFREYMQFHMEKRLFKDDFAPKPFTFAIRHPGYSPEGTIAIERTSGGGPQKATGELIRTFVRETEPRNMSFALNAATKVTFSGPHYVHGFLDHSLAGSNIQMRLLAQAREFSGFILILGKIKSSNEFDAQEAIVIQNRDELDIPIVLQQIPSPKAFQDYIRSLSPEQQRFARAFRGMQLEGTLFGLVLIQIKPAMEKVLRLAPGSLTKEIQLTQDLMTLFTKYQIPTDLLSFDDISNAWKGQDSGFEGADRPSKANPESRLTHVKQNVARMMAMVENKKAKVNEAAQQGFAFAKATGTAEKKSLKRKRDVPLGAAFNTEIHPEEVVAYGAALVGARISQEFQETSRILLLDVDIHGNPVDSVGGSENMAQADLGGSGKMAQEDLVKEEPNGSWEDGDYSEDWEDDGESSETEEKRECEDGGCSNSNSRAADGEVEDYTQLAVHLDETLSRNDKEGAVRPTSLVVGNPWSKHSRKTILSAFEDSQITKEEARREKDRTFDLLDALSRSGGLLLEGSSLHVIVAATHCFSQTLIDTVIQENVNPIDRVEKTALLLAAETHREFGTDAVSRMVRKGELARLMDTHKQEDLIFD
eukprot:CAMPEP_0114526308 /NCGR_PEP_ID=MMETSP0109-20121206/22944_1 /TAXON_ID=29199 /ORGANISM="Chlorarachnion reptans, Strain CCCM449" /LENGTH=982 /DNA_ID=CAMNT_0001708059 /DNA_START=177 /DNA_END=3125 /DNA_ORIENTATION=+